MKNSRTASRLAFGLWLALVPMAAIAPAGCGKKDVPAPATPTPEGKKNDPGDKGEPGSPRREAEPAGEAKVNDTAPAPSLPGPFASAGLLSVPKGAPFVMVGTPKKVLDAIGYAGLLDKYGALLGGVGSQMLEVTGKDFFKLASWAEIGIDLGSPMGVFMPELKREAFVTFVPLSDAAKLITFATETAKKMQVALTSEKIGDATLFSVGDRDRNVWLVKGDMLYAVVLMHGNGAAALAKEILALKEADSIVALPELKPALEGLAADEMGAFVQLRAIFETIMHGRGERPPVTARSYEKELEDAKKANDAERIAELERTIKTENEYVERSEKRHAAELELHKMLIAEFSTLSIGVDIGERSAEATVRLPLAEGGMLRGLIHNGSEPQSILKATKDQPLLLMGAHIDPKAYVALLEKAMATDGESLEEVRAALKEHVGIDLDQDIIASLTGELGFALTGDMANLYKVKDPREELGGALTLGLKSDAGLKTGLAKLASQEGLAKFVKWDEATSSLTLTVPQQRPIQVVLTGDRLLATTDVDTAARLGGGESFVAGLDNPKLKALLERKDLAAVFAMREEFMGMWILGMRSGRGFAPDMPADATPEVKAKFEELGKLAAEIEPLRVAVEEARMKPALDMLDKLGTLAEGATIDGQGAVATIGIYTKGATVPEVVQGLIELGMNMGRRVESSEDEKRLRELEDKRWKLESELWDANRPKAVEEAVPAPK